MSKVNNTIHGWCKESFAESVSQDDIPAKVEYIKNQEVHHGMVTLEDEMKEIYQYHHWIFLPEYLK